MNHEKEFLTWYPNTWTFADTVEPPKPRVCITDNFLRLKFGLLETNEREKKLYTSFRKACGSARIKVSLLTLWASTKCTHSNHVLRKDCPQTAHSLAYCNISCTLGKWRMLRFTNERLQHRIKVIKQQFNSFQETNIGYCRFIIIYGKKGSKFKSLHSGPEWTTKAVRWF